MLDFRLNCYYYQERTSNVSVIVDPLLMASRLLSPGLGRDIEMILMQRRCHKYPYGRPFHHPSLRNYIQLPEVHIMPSPHSLLADSLSA